tara:strand:+ start:411 stop:785 length:375 start_codon:yes stop_codon:yes gene_type:complete
LIGSAEPLGKGRFRLRSLNRSHSVVVPELGEGSIYTGYYSTAYGFRPSLDVSMLIPFLIDSAGGFNKYGSGDPVLRIAVVDFAGFEEYHAGRRLVDKIRTRLEPHDSLEVVDLSRYSGIRKKGP